MKATQESRRSGVRGTCDVLSKHAAMAFALSITYRREFDDRRHHDEAKRETEPRLGKVLPRALPGSKPGKGYGWGLLRH